MIAHNKPTFDQAEIIAAKRVFSSGWVAQGTEVYEFENEFCKYIGLPSGHALAVSSGTAALFLTLQLISKNKRVLMPAYVCSSVKHAITMAGGIPIFRDCRVNSPNINMNFLDNSVDLAIAVHTYGYPIEINEEISNLVIEDCCQALGSKINGQSVGLKGRFGIFSFYATKIMTSGGQGGMIVSRQKEEINKLKDLRDFDRKIDKIQRFNFQMTDLQAAIGRAQLKKLPYLLSRRKEIFNNYIKAGISLENSDDPNINHYRAILRIKNVKEIKKKLLQKGISSIIPLEINELHANLPNAKKYAETSLSLPVYPTLTDEQLDQIINVLS